MIFECLCTCRVVRPASIAALLVISLTMPEGSAVAQSTGLLATYSFDEGTGTTVGDSSGSAYYYRCDVDRGRSVRRCAELRWD